jgi:hypothetical protein
MMQGQQSNKGQGQRGGQGRGQGQPGAMPGGMGQPAARTQAFPTPDGGLWLVDGRTGDVLYCRAVVDGSAAAGFVPVCSKADL